MKTKKSAVWGYTLIAAIGLSLVACGNSQKKRENAAERRMAEQPVDAVSVIESQTVVVIDSLAPDSSAMQKNMVAPAKTK